MTILASSSAGAEAAAAGAAGAAAGATIGLFGMAGYFKRDSFFICQAIEHKEANIMTGQLIFGSDVSKSGNQELHTYLII